MRLDPKYLKAAVFGASDGIVTTFAVVAGVVGANLSTEVILILGIANMFADGFSMAVGDYIGERSSYKLKLEYSLKADGKQLWKTSLVTFISFVLAGSLPLIPYTLMLIGFTVKPEHQFGLSIISTGLSMFFVGSLRTIFTKGKWWMNGFEMFFIGSVAAFVAYSLGAFIESFLR